jgi:hypothetical protein
MQRSIIMLLARRLPGRKGDRLKKFVLSIAASLLVLNLGLVVGCGGGGSSDGGPPPPPAGFTTGEAALLGTPNTPIDPRNIQAGETVQFQVVHYDTGLTNRTIVASTNWTTTDNGNTAGILQPDGTFAATAATGPNVFTATGTAGGQNYSVAYRVKPVQALVTGVIQDSNGASAYHVAIVFYNSSGVEVSRALSQFDGTFRASMPTTAVVFNLDSQSVTTTKYFRSFKFGGKRYTTLEQTCSAPLPALTNGTTTSIGTLVIDAAFTGGIPNPPPPPPDGCA